VRARTLARTEDGEMGNGERGWGNGQYVRSGGDGNLGGEGGGSGDVSETPETAPDAGAGVVLCVCLSGRERGLCEVVVVVVVVWKRCHGLKEKRDVQLPPSPSPSPSPMDRCRPFRVPLPNPHPHPSTKLSSPLTSRRRPHPHTPINLRVLALGRVVRVVGSC
jgi:hypothetical protein